MGGVDLCDMLMSLYRIELGSKKWYTHIVYYCMELQSWILGSYIRNIAVKMALHSVQTCWHCLTSRQELQILCCIKKKQLFVEGLELIVQLWWNTNNQQIMLEQLLKSHLIMLVIFLSDDDIAEGHLVTILPKLPQSQVNTAIPKVSNKSYLKSVLFAIGPNQNEYSRGYTTISSRNQAMFWLRSKFVVLADFRHFFLAQMLDLPQWFPPFWPHLARLWQCVLPLISIRTLNNEASAQAFHSELIDTLYLYFRGKTNICGSEECRLGIEIKLLTHLKLKIFELH